jgi:hypothetical protein
MVSVGLFADPPAIKLVALKAIAVHYRRLGSQNGDPGRIGYRNIGDERQ